MSLSETIQRIETNVQHGLLFRAADRLDNLIRAYPDDLSLRDRLAQLYYDAGFLDAAGRYWMLSDSDLPHVAECVAIYERSVNHSGTQMLRDIAFRGNRSILSETAAAKLKALEEDSIKRSGHVPTFLSKGFRNRGPWTKQAVDHPLKNAAILFVIVLLIISLLIGAVEIVRAFVHLMEYVAEMIFPTA